MRRSPRQPRAAFRRATFLASAACLIGKSGYEALTMTAVAEHARASIGTLYDYFPDKPSLALALLAQYTEEADAHWAARLPPASPVAGSSLAGVFIDGILDFVRGRPAYLALLGAPLVYSRSPAARKPLRATIAAALQSLNPDLPDDRAFLAAQVTVELLKAFLAVYKQTAPKLKAATSGEFKKVLQLYLAETLA